jgi:predicted MFS family arabinose efflux permease
VAVAFADSSIVVLALPELYSAFNTSIVGVSWVITAYNVVVAVGAFALLPVIARVDVARLTRGGLSLFCVGSIGCAAAGTLPLLITCRCVQGAGAAMLLAGTLSLLSALAGSPRRGVALWIGAGTLGAALGPALGGILTQVFDWRAIFVFQAPVALVALVAARRSHVHPAVGVGRSRRVASNVALALVFGALVGALFLAVLLVIDVWGLSPIAGAAVVSALPLGALGGQGLRGQLVARTAAAAGTALLAAGLLALALLPAISPALAAIALTLCGVGMGLCVPGLTHVAIHPEQGLVHDGTVTTGARHVGLVLALLLVAPLLSHDLQRGGRNAILGGTHVLLTADIPVTKVVPIALDLRTTLDRTPRGKVPDVTPAFDKQGARHDRRLASARDALQRAIQAAITRSFRRPLALCAGLAVLALVPVLALWRRRWS